MTALEEEIGDLGYAVVDVEAVMICNMRIVLQVAFVLVSPTGQELLGEKHLVYQPLTAEQLSEKYKCPLEIVRASMRTYAEITGDTPVHDDPLQYPCLGAVRTRLRRIMRARAIRVYAKGAALEKLVFGDEMEVHDLEWTGCPVYPSGNLHDPLKECRFFSTHIPEVRSRALRKK